MPEVASQTLDFVGRELNVTLAEARTALENYVEQPDNVNLLERCTQELHQVQGVLRVLEIYGAALLAEEMEQVASYLLATASERKSQAESLDALMRAMVQLPSYLERVLAGGRDLALVLLPLLNDLRAVRGSALLSEGTLLLLNLKSDKQAAPVAASPGEPPLTVEQWARRLRARFQVGLIGWIRGERIEQNLDILAAVAQKLEQIATRQPVFQLWWVTGAVIEALQENGLEGGVSIKRLLGLGDREIRRLYEQGEPRYAQTPAVELLNNLLYYVGRAESSGPRVMAVRASFRLSELLPVDESIEQERENLSAPSVKLMQTVAIAIREDLSKVKDVLDIFVRRGAGQPKELASQVEMLRKIGDTLGVLGLGELRGNVQAETERLERIVAGTLPADEATLVQIAATLISVEDRLDGQLVGLIRPKNATEPEEDEDNEFQQVQAAVLRECILNLARIKEAITQNVGGTLDAAGLDSWQELMRGLKAGLLMLGKARAVEVIEGVTGQLKRVMQPGGQGLPPGFMDRLADAIVSVEYYMETLQAGRSDPWYMLDNAQACVQALEHQQAPVIPTVPPVEPSAYARTLQISSSGVFGADADPGSTLVGASGPLTTTRSNVPPLAETADPELVKLFIEEAHEELAKIKKFFPAWDQNPMERDSLITVRRSFHTLKGSGRMVGARELGEFAWSIENLLNRVLDNTLTRSPQIVEVLRDSVNALPELVEQLETGRAPRVDAASIAGRAQALAAGRPAPTVTARAAASQAAPSPGAPSGSSLTGTLAIPNVVPIPTPKSPERPTFAQSATSSEPAPAFAPDRNSHTQTVVSVHPQSRSGAVGFSAFAGHSLADGNVQIAAPPLLEERGRAFPESAAPELSSSGPSEEPFSSELGIPELAGPSGASPEWEAPQLAAGLDDLDLVLPEEPSTQEPPVVEADAGFEAPVSAGAEEEEAAAIGEPPVLGSSLQEESSPPAFESAQSGPDDVLRDIYTRETGTHVATVRAYLDREEGMSEPHAIPEDVYRACHTLSGSSKMAQARHGTRLAEPLDHWLRRVFNSGLGLQNQDMALLADCMVAMEAVVSHLDEVTGYFHTHVGLQERIGQAEKILDHRIAEAAQQQTDGSLLGEEDELSEDAGDFDPEVAAIFTEEAMELIEFSESALTDWRSEPGSAEYRSALKRPLHTLKGGARMAGITAMGDLSHELETLVMQVDNGSVATDDAMFDVIQASLDELARMREAVANGRRVSGARAMIARIHSLSKPRGAAAPAAGPEAAVSQAPPIPPAPQSYAPPPPALTSAEQEPPTDATSEPQAEAAYDLQPPVTPDGEPAPELADAESAHSEPMHHELAVSSDSETQLARALEPRRSDLPDTLIAPLPPFSFDEVGGSDPMSGDLAAELLASYPATPDRPDEEHEIVEPLETADGDAATYDLSRADVADLSADQPSQAGELGFGGAQSDHDHGPAADAQPAGYGEPAAHREPAADGQSSAGGGSADYVDPAAHVAPADDHIASDYMTARDSAANEEVANAQPWTPESTQAQPSLDEPSQPEAALPVGASANDASAPFESPVFPEQQPSAAPVAEQAAPIASVAKSVSVSLARPGESRSPEEGLLPPQAVPPGREPVAPAERQEMARVDAELLDQLLNISGEASIARSRLEQQLGSIDFNLGELSRTVTRLKEQLRNLEIETEAQILHRHEDESSHRGDFDPLELDRYSSIQQFSRALAETANDVGSIQQLLENLGKETQNLLQQQARTITELQNGLMRTRMVPFQRHVQRLARIVRQAASDTGKRADLTVEGASGELDRQVLERMLPPFEHMLRNAVVHGIEKPRDRVAAGKPEAGRIVLELHREGAEVMVRLTDDGGGMNLKAIRDKGAALGLIAPGQTLSDEDAMQLILEPGFSTAGTITQQAGRGVGMDVVATEIKRLGGALHMETKPGQGTVFTIRLPFTLAISHALVVRTGDEYYALPLPTVEGVLRLSKAEVTAHLGKDASAFDYGGQKYRFQHLATFVALEPSPLPEQDVTIPVVLVRAGEHSTGLVADELVGSREIVVKSVGPQISSIRGISGATILGDGRIVIILDIGALVRAEWRGRAQPVPVAPKDKSDKRTFAMVVDDSITVRRVTQRLLERNGMRVLTARDGMDAVTLLQDNIPDVILLDIEMPRMDGYEVAAHVRNDPRLKDVPIIMITSRVGEKHRARAIELGVDDYLGKPYQEAQLLDAIAPLVERRRGPQSTGTFDRVSDARV
jgi:chemosensory pili system protein ChpA (sensor histidine kinase/response regulator)